jgi:hypothetical protein
VKEKNLVIPTGDRKYVTIPMPLGFHVIPNLSRIAMEFALSGFEKPAQRAAQLLGVGAEAFNPIGNSGLSIQTLTPTIIDPLAALAENRDFTGRSIARRDFSSLDPTPGHARAKDTATPWAILASQALNYMSGGNEFRPGAFSPTPDQIDYLIGQLTGGVGREAGKAAQTVSAWATGEELPAHKIPGLGRFYGDATGTAAISNRFYDNVKEANLAWATIEGLRKQGRLAEARESLREHPISRLRLAASRSQSSINNMRALRKQMETHGAPQERIREMDEKITQVMRRFNDLASAQSE